MKESSEKDTIDFYKDVYKKVRKTWKINPVERVVKSKKKYKRSVEKNSWKREQIEFDD